ncbi:MAG TPA: hypothetical protein VHB79_11370 [Polyangiaceae bacterium]|nr:hypothetical protein [Polyangiaceae bacterium]
MRFGALWVVRSALLLAAPAVGFAACSGSSSGRSGQPTAGSMAEGGDGGAQDSGGTRNSGDPQAGADDEGGTAGRGGAAGGFGGSGGSAGHAGGSAGAAATVGTLGSACTKAADCANPKFPALTCVTGKDTLFGDGAPPKGLCTMPCTVPTQSGETDPCEVLDPSSICYAFDDSNKGYCLEGCHFGPLALREPQKCHGRAEFSCRPALFGATNSLCDVSTDCPLGELCSGGVCYENLPACLPSCAGDIDCEVGMYCDQQYGGGTCVTKKQIGKALGEPCTVPAANEPAEPDECLGWCAADQPGSSKGHCLTTCTYGAPCAYNSASKKYDGACLFASQQLLGGPAATGDTGYCDLACNCSSECSDATLDCELLPGGALGQSFRGAGLCFLADDVSVPYDQCGTGGAPGAAGAPAGGAGG